MKGYKLLSSAIIMTSICLSFSNIHANAEQITSEPHEHCLKREGSMRKSINQLKDEGVLTEKEVNNIYNYMNEQRKNNEMNMKERIYLEKCKKIDDMISKNIISKEKGEKLKVTIKQNIN